MAKGGACVICNCVIGSNHLYDPEFFGTRVGCHVSAVEWV